MVHQYDLNNKTLVIGVIILFLGITVQPAVATVELEEIIEFKPKNYLFQTIMNLVDNPDITKLLNQYNKNLFKVDIDKKLYPKILFILPRLFQSLIFTKSSMTIEYLEKCYNTGIEITNILGEDKVIEIMESVEITDKEFLNKLSSVIMNDEKLSYRFSALEKMNKELKSEPPFWEYPIICTILLIIITPFNLIMIFAEWFNEYLDFFPILNSIMNLIYNVTFKISYPIDLAGFILGCWYI